MDEESDKTAMKNVLNNYAKAIITGDLELWMALWVDDGVQMPPGAPTNIGKKQIREGNKWLFEDFDCDLTVNSIEEVTVFGDIGWSRCTYSLKGTPKSGGETIDFMADGKAFTLMKRQPDGSWRIAYDSFNSNIPPT